MAVSTDDFERVYASRYRPFRHGSAAIVGDYERAHDVVQNAFAKAINSRDQFRGGSLEAWIWRIVERESFAARSAPEALPLEADFDLGVEDPELDHELAEAISALAPRRRLIVFLRYFADLSYDEIARICQIEPGTVAATLSSAHAELRSALTTKEVTR